MAQPPVDPRFDPVFQRGYDPAQHGRPTTSRPASSAPIAAPPEDVATTVTPLADDAVDDELPAARNPWLLALLVASIAMLAAAGLLLYLLATSPNNQVNGRDALATVIQNLLYQAPPALITAGFVGVALRLSLGLLLRRR